MVDWIAPQQTPCVVSFSSITIGGSALVVDRDKNFICVAETYAVMTTMTGCLVFNDKTFATMGGGGLIDGVTSTASWNIGTGNTQSITFVTNKAATSKICFPPPVAPPVTAPIEPPVAAPVVPPVVPPVAAPIELPVAAPVTAPIEPPVAAPVVPPFAAPVAAVPMEPPVSAPVAAPVLVAPVVAIPTGPIGGAPVTPPTTGGDASIVPILIGAVLSIIGAIAAVVFCIW